MESVLFSGTRGRWSQKALIITRFENNIVPWDMEWYSKLKGNYQEIWVQVPIFATFPWAY